MHVRAFSASWHHILYAEMVFLLVLASLSGSGSTLSVFSCFDR